MTQPDPQGARALEHRIDVVWNEQDSPKALATDILSDHGLFIADRTKHEPTVSHPTSTRPFIWCSCGWNADAQEPPQRWLDHIGGAE